MRFFIPFLTIFLYGCQTASFAKKDYLAAYQSGQITSAQNIVAKATAAKDFTRSNDAVWLLLDSATIKFANGDTEGAIADYQLAIEAIDYYNQDSPAELLGQIALQDDVAAYPGEDFEQVLARVYFALVLLQNGDENNALALLRQAEEVQQKKRENYRNDRLTQNFELIDNPVAKYLMAALLEHRGDHSNAAILFNQTETLIGYPLSAIGLAKQIEENETATVIIVVHNGNSPYKVSKTSDASLASTIALEMMLGSSNRPAAISGFTGIPTPYLMQKIYSHRFPLSLRLCRQDKIATTLYNVQFVAARQLDQKLPIIVAKGVARFALRRAAVAGCYENSDSAGALMDLGMLVANICTQADTRTWGTLPSSIDLARYDVQAGNHTLHVQTNWSLTPTYIGEIPLQLEANDFCVINVFNIHPGVVSVQVPKKNKNTQNMEFSHDSQSDNNCSPSPIVDGDAR